MAEHSKNDLRACILEDVSETQISPSDVFILSDQGEIRVQ